MIVDIGKNPRITHLLGRIEETRRRASDRPEGDAVRLELEEEVARCYADLGRYVHWLVRQPPESLARIEAEARRWAKALDERLGEEVVEPLVEELDDFEDLSDVEALSTGDFQEASVSVADAPDVALDLTGDSRTGMDVRELVQPGGYVDVEPEPLDDVPAPGPRRPTPVPVVKATVASADDEPSQGTGVSDLVMREQDEDPFARDEDALATGGIAVITGSFEAPDDDDAPAADVVAAVSQADDDWLTALRALLENLGGPDDTADETADGIKSVVVGTTNLEVHWSVYPEAVQQALLGLVGARIRRIQVAGAVKDPDLRLALGRMRRFAEDRGLLVAQSLRKEPPTGRDWHADERRYWAVLRAGL